ncbi:choice-of-anchor L domain-containing protein [Cloacibacterium sp. Arc13]|uniref:choice-of-anchor L domain-containing protein n=1 Tax=unclassified Cloacibacterium TaxID=2620870 RepID=UPI00352FDF59
MVKNWTKYVLLLLTLITISVRAQYISVNTSYNKDQLVQKLIGANNTCISVSNVTLSGWNFDTGNISDGTTGTGDLSYGFFTKGTSNFDINEGIILSTGKAKAAQGPNDNLQDYYATNWREDQDLIDILTKYNLPTDNILNATSLEFDFIANTDKISFDYMFLSEEYQKTNCKYSDAFAFLIKKADNSEAYRNIAIVPNTTSPVTSLTISGANICPQNINYFGGYLGIDDPNNSPTNFNGQTKVLNAESSIEKGVKYHIKLVIADHGDSSGRYDSAVFLKAGSFVGSKDIGTDRLISTNNPLCEGSTLTLDATVSGATYQWFQNGNILTGETSATYTVTSEGRYEVNISSSSCNLRGAITVEYIEKAKATKITFTNCDTNFDGNIPIKLDDLNTTIITNYKPEFVVKYYQNLTDATLSNANTLPNNWSYNTDTTIYVRVENGVCAPEIQPIEFIFGNKISVTNYSTTICDGDFNNTEAVNLDNYLPQLTSETGYSRQFYLTKNDADLEQNPIAPSQNLTATTTFYVRIKKSGICDNIAVLTFKFGQPKKSNLPPVITVCEGETTNLDAGLEFSAYLWSNGETSHQIKNVGKGDYYVILTSENNCTYIQKISVVESPKAIIDISKFNTTVCDQNLDGTIEVNLNNVTAAILLNPGIYRVKYYANITDANAGNANVLNNSWSFSTDTTIFVRVESDYCPALIHPLEFKFGNRVTLLTSTLSQEVCDDDLDAIKSVNLKTFESFFTTDNSVSITYFNSENDAKNNINPISSTQNITSTGTYFLRLEHANSCPNWAKITVNIKTPKASTTLQNKTICKNTTTVVDAGTDFTYYKWSNGTEGETLHNATYGAGTHFVELKAENGCVYKQYFTISEAVDPVIDSVIEQGNSITVNVSGGTAPYEYSLDQINWQTSNMFYNLNRGIQKVYVRDSKKCSITEYEFSIIKLLNAITPNGDGLNDVLDYSDLRVKKEVKILIFDRFGKKIFSNENSTSYIWDGTENGRPLPSGSYWYILEWTEPDTGIKINNKDWILLKNRN